MPKKKNVYLYDEVKNKIINDTINIPAHTRVPTRMEMMAAYNVTRTTIEKAISQLIGEGYLYSRDGSGTYIAERNNGQPSNGKNAIESWGVLIRNIMHDTYPEIFRGIEDFANARNINVILCNTDNDVEKQGEYIEKLVESGVSGIIIVPALGEYPGHESFRYLAENNVPFVFCVRKVENIKAPQVISNNFYGALIVTEHFVKLGYKRIAYAGPASYSVVEHRLQGYLAYLTMAGHTISNDYIYIDGGDFDADQEQVGRAAVKALFMKNTLKPDAFVCFNDRIAQGVYWALEEEGLKIGRDIGLAGYDDSSICTAMPVKLTTVRYPKYETGWSASEILYGIINGEDFRDNHTVVLQPSLIIRQSCGGGSMEIETINKKYPQSRQAEIITG